MTQGIGYKSKLYLNGSGSGALLGGVVDGWERSAETEMVDITVLGLAKKKYFPADTDPGETSFDVALDGSDTNLAALVTARDNGTLVTLVEVLSNGVTETYTGYVKTIGKTVKKRELLTSKITIQESEAL